MKLNTHTHTHKIETGRKTEEKATANEGITQNANRTRHPLKKP